MSTDTTSKQNFRRVWGPADNGECSGRDNVIFELTSGYEGDLTPSGRTPCFDVTYYVVFYPEGEHNQPEGDYPDGLWAIEETCHSYLRNPASDYPDEPEDEEYSYEGGSDLWYYSEASAIEHCRESFAKYDESWKLNDWTPE